MDKQYSCDCENCDLKTLFYDSVLTPDLDTICAQKAEKNFKQGETIIEANTPIKEFIYLKTGFVKLYKTTTDGRDQIITFAKPLDFVSLLSVFSNENYNYSVSAIEESVTCSLDFKFVTDLINVNGKFAHNILNKMSAISDKIILDTIALRHKQLRGRVAHLLIYFSEKIYNSEEFDLPVSRREMSEYIGMSTENVIRTLSEFRSDKIIKIFGKTIEIADMQKLKQISDFG